MNLNNYNNNKTINKFLESIIFDFDGVIADSVDIKTKAFFSIYEKYGPDISKKVITHHENNPGISRFEKFKFYHDKFLNVKIGNKDLNTLSNQFSNLVKKKIIECSLIDGVIEFLEIYRNEIPMFIVSATPLDEIRYIAQKKNISHYFEEILGSPKNKKFWTDYILNKYSLQNSRSIFIGDGIQDFIAAKQFDINFIARVDRLDDNTFKNEKVKFFIKDFHEIHTVINSIFKKIKPIDYE